MIFKEEMVGGEKERDRRTDGRTKGQVENIMVLAILTWWKYEKRLVKIMADGYQ